MDVIPVVRTSFHPNPNTIKGIVYGIYPPVDGSEGLRVDIFLGTDTTHPELSIKATDYETPDVEVNKCTNGLAQRALILSTGRVQDGSLYMQIQCFDGQGKRVSGDNTDFSIVNQAASALEQATRDAMRGMMS